MSLAGNGVFPSLWEIVSGKEGSLARERDKEVSVISSGLYSSPSTPIQTNESKLVMPTLIEIRGLICTYLWPCAFQYFRAPCLTALFSPQSFPCGNPLFKAELQQKSLRFSADCHLLCCSGK